LADDNQNADLNEEAHGASAAAPELGPAEALPASDLDLDPADSTPRSRHVHQGAPDMTSVTTAQEPGSTVAAVSRPATPRERDPRIDRARDHEKRPEQSLHKAFQDGSAAEPGVARSVAEPQSPATAAPARALVQASAADPRTIKSELSSQSERILRLSHETSINHAKTQALLARLSARIDELSALERQLQGSWRRLSMEAQNRTQQNMGGN
jgi:hypothetical protein